MHPNVALLLAFAAGSSAYVVADSSRSNLVARQESPQPSPSKAPINSACKAVLKTMPTPPPDVKAAFIKQFEEQKIKSPCDFSVPAEMKSEVESFTSAVSVWGNENKAQITGACTSAPQFLAFTACSNQPAASTPAIAARQESPAPSPAPSQTGGIDEACKAVLKTMPTPPPDVKAAFIQQFEEQKIKSPCDFSVPAEMKSEVASFTSAVSVWGNENKAQITSACPKAPQFLAFTACSNQPAATPTA